MKGNPRRALVLLVLGVVACSDPEPDPIRDAGGDARAADGSAAPAPDSGDASGAPSPDSTPVHGDVGAADVGQSDAPLDGPVDGPAGDTADAPAADAPGSDAAAADALPPPSDVPPPTTTLCTPPSRWVRLPYVALAAQYSRSLERLVMIGDDRALHLYDPETCVDSRVSLPRSAQSLSLHPGGKEVVVGHDGRVSLWDLSTLSAGPVLDLPLPVTHVAFDAQRRVHAWARAERTTAVPLHTVFLGDGSLRLGRGLLGDGGLKMSPDGRGLLWHADESTTSTDYFRLDPDTGMAANTPLPFRPERLCGNLFFTDDSRRVVLGCGTVVRSAPGTDQDLGYESTLEGVSSIQHLDSHVASDRVVLIPRRGNLNGQLELDSAVRVHDSHFYNYIKTMRLPRFTSSDPIARTAAHGRFVFVRGDGFRYYVIAGADTLLGEARMDTVVTLEADGPETPEITPLPLPGATAAPSVPIPPTTRPQTIHPLSFDIADADYSRTADRVLVASTQPPALQVLDPATGQSETLALPAAPRRLLVRPDGAVAAVVFESGVRFIDLVTRTTLREVSGAVQHLGFAPPPRVLLGMGSDAFGWLSLDTGTITPGARIFGPSLFFVGATFSRPDYYVSSSDRLGRYADDATFINLYQQGFDLSLFRADFPIVSCGQRFWLLDGEKRLLLDCGRAFKLSATESEDLRYLGSLDFVSQVQHGTYAASIDRFVSIPTLLRTPDGYATFEQLAIHDPRTLAFEKNVPLAALVTNQDGPTQGRFVFESKQPGRFYVLAVSARDPSVRALIVLDL